MYNREFLFQNKELNMIFKNNFKTTILLLILLNTMGFANSITVGDDISTPREKTVELTATGSCQNSSNEPQFQWTIDEKINDGVFSTESVFWFYVDNSYSQNQYHITATMLCLDEPAIKDTLIVSVIENNSTNQPPIANAGADQTISWGENVMLTGINSQDSDGSIVSYLWKEGNTTLDNAISFGKDDFDVGEHTITLTVTDNDGATNSDTVIVTVINDNNSLQNGLLAYYKFEENANDSSENQNHGTSYGGVSYSDGKVGKSAHFDGVDDYIKINNNYLEGSDNYSISSWIKLTDDSCSKVVKMIYSIPSHYGTDNAIHLDIRCNTNSIDNYIYSQQYSKVNNLDIKGKWRLVTVTKNSDDLYIYLGKDKVGSFKVNPSINYGVARSVLIGADDDRYSDGDADIHWFHGLIDELRVYNRALSDTEIEKIYTLGEEETNNSLTIEKNTIEEDVIELKAIGECIGDTMLPSFSWTIQERIADGAFSTEAIFWFTPNPSWNIDTYHINVKMKCYGESDLTKEIIIKENNNTAVDGNCTHFTADGTCIYLKKDAINRNLYLKHGENPMIVVENIPEQYNSHITYTKFLPSPNGAYSIFWTPYNQMTDDFVFMKRFNNNGEEIVPKKSVTVLGHMGYNPQIVLLKNDNFIVHACHHHISSRFGLFSKNGDQINSFSHSNSEGCNQGNDANITPFDDGGFRFSYADFNSTFDSNGNQL